MTKQMNRRRQSFLLSIMAAFIVLAGSGAAFGQKADKYPTPDFKAMEEYFDIVETEYDFTTNIPTFIVVAKPKAKVVPTWWNISWRDAKGVAIHRYRLYFTDVRNTKRGEPTRGTSYAPFRDKMLKVKSVLIEAYEEDPHDEKTAN